LFKTSRTFLLKNTNYFFYVAQLLHHLFGENIFANLEQAQNFIEVVIDCLCKNFF